VSPDMTFAMKPYFRNQFTMRDVREGVIVTFIRHIVQVCNVSILSVYYNDVCGI
jgi:hypothetical protein